MQSLPQNRPHAWPWPWPPGPLTAAPRNGAAGADAPEGAASAATTPVR
ncbi:MAG TPA: hypothetical protein VF545_01835 [Thermoleophilaceae bacterium]|jgi:hypothetical protein